MNPPQIKWAKKLESGIEEIDQQHKMFFKKIDRLLDECIAKTNKELILEDFKFLGLYIIEHFGAEEELMKKFKYPSYVEHKKKHMEIRKELENLKNQTNREGINPNLILKFSYFLVDWLMDQILVHDKKMCSFLREKSKQNRSFAERLKIFLRVFSHN